jgi:chemotaxis-related protein WspD
MDPRQDTAQDLVGANIEDCWNKIGVRGDRSCAELERYVHCRNCPVYFAGAIALLDRSAPSDYLAGWTAHFAEPKQLKNSETRSVMIFRIGPEWLGLPIEVVSEVTSARRIHSLPHRRGGVVIGLANVRGELVVCASLAHILGIAPANDSQEGSNLQSLHARLLVIRRDNVRMVCPVDEVHGIQRFHPLALQDAPTTVTKAAASYSRAILVWNKHSVGILDDERLFGALKRSIG